MRLALTVSYKGTPFCGWQVQNDEPSVQLILEDKLSRILRQPIRLIVSGRTDAGVHAVRQVCHFDCDDTRAADIEELLKPPKDKRKLPSLVHRLNSILPPEIAVHEIKPVADDFHAQKSAKLKEYCYYILNGPVRNVFLNDYAWKIPYELDFKAMRKAARHFIGRHDFTSFCATDSTAKTRERKVKGISIKKIKLPPPFKGKGDLYEFTFTGEGFLKQMVRNLMGTLVAVGLKEITPQDAKRILKAKSRQKTPATAPARGLFLMKVEY